MNSGKIEAEKLTLGKIFGEEFWFTIPNYQRPYVWQKDHVNELLDDLYFAFENKSQSDYFLGSLVLKRKEERNYEVLDGQQRLTSFCIILSCLRDMTEDLDIKEDIHKLLFERGNKLKKIESRCKLVTEIRKEAQDFIEKFIIEKKGSDQQKELKTLVGDNDISISNMSNAILVTRDFLKAKSERDEFASFITEKSVFIYVSTDNTEDAFRLFTILNNRGLPLTSADILKSKNMGAIKDKFKDEYAKRWEELERNYGYSFERFLAFIRTILVKEKARVNLLEEFEQNIYNKQKLSLGINTVNTIIKYDKIFQEIIELNNNKLTNEYKNLLTIMRIGLVSEDWIPPLLCYYEKFGHNQLEEFLKRLEYKFSGDWISQKSPTARIEAMNSILKTIDKTDCQSDIINSKELFSIDENYYKHIISEDVYGRRFTRYLLLKLEYLMRENDTVHFADYKHISVEHVLPQNPKLDSEWCVLFNEDERKKWTNKIANLVLISKRKNSALSNQDFQLKKETYLKKRVDVFKATDIFLEQNIVWNLELLQSRQKKLTKMLLENNVG